MEKERKNPIYFCGFIFSAVKQSLNDFPLTHTQKVQSQNLNKLINKLQFYLLQVESFPSISFPIHFLSNQTESRIQQTKKIKLMTKKQKRERKVEIVTLIAGVMESRQETRPRRIVWGLRWARIRSE